MSYFVTYRRKQPVGSFGDVGTVFSKFIINDDIPGQVRTAMDAAPAGAEYNPNARPAAPKVYANSGEVDCTTSHANTLTLQDGPTAMLLTHPHLSLGGPAGGSILASAKATPLHRLAELVVFPSHFGVADELCVGTERRTEWSGDVAHGQWIVCRRGRLLIAVRPMAYTRTMGRPRITLQSVPNYQLIRVTFYDGAPRVFTREELRHMFGGFVAEHAGVEEYASTEAFAKAVAAGQFTDYFWTTRRARYRRPANAARAALEMEMSASPGSVDTRIAAINGQPVATPAVQIDGIQQRELAFMNDKFRSVPSFFPWKDFSVEWGDWPYAINDRED